MEADEGKEGWNGIVNKLCELGGDVMESLVTFSGRRRNNVVLLTSEVNIMLKIENVKINMENVMKS